MQHVGEGELGRADDDGVAAEHGYDELGLLCPSERSEAGYRLYGYADLARLQEILIWRALGFSLAEIRRLLDDPAHDRLEALRGQRELVRGEIERLGALAAAVDAAIDAELTGSRPEETTMFEGFDPAVAERHREHISRWFYPCSPAMHRGLAEMYVADERFRETYEREADGLAAYLHDAILANAGGAPDRTVSR